MIHPEGTILIGGGSIDEMLEAARRAPYGPIVEVGVWRGDSAKHLMRLANERDVTLWLYDTFEGMPYQGPLDRHEVGDFSDTSYQRVKDALPNAIIVKGVFPESARLRNPGHVAFAHLDCDQEQSYREAIAYLRPMMMAGGVMWFDDAPALAGAKYAVGEAFGDTVRTSPLGKWWVQL